MNGNEGLNLADVSQLRDNFGMKAHDETKTRRSYRQVGTYTNVCIQYICIYDSVNAKFDMFSWTWRTHGEKDAGRLSSRWQSFRRLRTDRKIWIWKGHYVQVVECIPFVLDLLCFVSKNYVKSLFISIVWNREAITGKPIYR